MLKAIFYSILIPCEYIYIAFGSPMSIIYNNKKNIEGNVASVKWNKSVIYSIILIKNSRIMILFISIYHTYFVLRGRYVF